MKEIIVTGGFLGNCRGLVLGFPMDTKSMDAKVPYIKSHSIFMEPTHILCCIQGIEMRTVDRKFWGYADH